MNMKEGRHNRWVESTLFRYLCCKIGVRDLTAQAETISQKAITFSHQQAVSYKIQRKENNSLNLLPHMKKTECDNLAQS